MVVCELCGKSTDKSVKVNVAGSYMNACMQCKNLGKNVAFSDKSSHKFYKKQKPDEELVVLDNAVSIVKSCISKENMTVEQLSNILNIKDSTLSKMLNKKISIDINTAKKIQNFFNINLLEKKSSENTDYEDVILDKNELEEDSLGDLIMKKIKNKN